MPATPTRPSNSTRRRGRLTRLERNEAEALLAEPVTDYMDDPVFEADDAYEQLFETPAEIAEPNSDWYRPGYDPLDEPAHPPKATPLLTAAQERTLFLQFNYARRRVATLQTEYDDASDDMTTRQVRDLLFWHSEAGRLREKIVGYNLGLVLAMARHVSASRVDFTELVSEGHMALLRAVDKFDVKRNFKFSTYACRAILKGFSRMSIKHARRRALFPVKYDPAMDSGASDERFEQTDLHEYTASLREVLDHNRAGLTKRERRVIGLRFLLDDDAPDTPPTLAEVGKMIGYSKERVRQIQVDALGKIRDVMQQRFSESPF